MAALPGLAGQADQSFWHGSRAHAMNDPPVRGIQLVTREALLRADGMVNADTVRQVRRSKSVENLRNVEALERRPTTTERITANQQGVKKPKSGTLKTTLRRVFSRPKEVGVDRTTPLPSQPSTSRPSLAVDRSHETLARPELHDPNDWIFGGHSPDVPPLLMTSPLVPAPRGYRSLLPSSTPSPRSAIPQTSAPSSPVRTRGRQSSAATPAISSRSSLQRGTTRRGSLVRRRDSFELNKRRASRSKESSSERSHYKPVPQPLPTPPVPSRVEPWLHTVNSGPVYNSFPREAMETASLIARVGSIEDRLAMMESEARSGKRRLGDLEQQVDILLRLQQPQVPDVTQHSPPTASREVSRERWPRRFSNSSVDSAPRTPPQPYAAEPLVVSETTDDLEKPLRDSLLNKGHEYSLHRVFEVVNAEHGARMALQADMASLRLALEQLHHDLVQSMQKHDVPAVPKSVAQAQLDSRFSTDSSVASGPNTSHTRR